MVVLSKELSCFDVTRLNTRNYVRAEMLERPGTRLDGTPDAKFR